MDSSSCSCASAPAGLRIRRATPDDADILVELIRELAAFEQLSAECHISIEAVQQHLFGPARCAEALVVWLEEAPVGFAVYYRTFSTFAARPGVFVEDLYVRERFRRRGIGRALLRDLARIAQANGAGRLEWTTLQWNQNARKVYAGVGAREMNDWLLLRMEPEAIAQFAGHCAGHPGNPVANCGCGGRGPHHGAAQAKAGSCNCG